MKIRTNLQSDCGSSENDGVSANVSLPELVFDRSH